MAMEERPSNTHEKTRQTNKKTMEKEEQKEEEKRSHYQTFLAVKNEVERNGFT